MLFTALYGYFFQKVDLFLVPDFKLGFHSPISRSRFKYLFCSYLYLVSKNCAQIAALSEVLQIIANSQVKKKRKKMRWKKLPRYFLYRPQWYLILANPQNSHLHFVPLLEPNWRIFYFLKPQYFASVLQHLILARIIL